MVSEEFCEEDGREASVRRTMIPRGLREEFCRAFVSNHLPCFTVRAFSVQLAHTSTVQKPMPFVNPYITKTQEHPRVEINTPQLALRRGNWKKELGELPIFLEIGVGMGRFFRDRATKETDKTFVGFEIRYKRLWNTASKLNAVRPHGWMLAKALGEDVARYFQPQELSGVFILFPDPWAKKKQRKHRLMQAPFLRDLALCIKPGGILVFKTDHQEYFSTTLAQEFCQVPEWKCLYTTNDLHSDSAKDAQYLHTEFEDMTTRKEGAKICLSEWMRV